MKNFGRIAMLAVIIAVCAACHRRTLNDPNELVQLVVTVDTRNISNVTSDIYNPNIPVPDLNTDMLRVLLYNPSTRSLMSQSFISNKTYQDEVTQIFSGTLNIGFGNFDLIAYNFDTPTTLVKSESNEDSAVAYTEAVPESVRAKYSFSKSLNLEDIDINYEPDHFMVARESNLRVSPHDSLYTIYTTAHSIIDTYYLQVRVIGAQYASSATAVISGLSPSNVFGINSRTEVPSAAVAFDIQKSTDSNIAGEEKNVLCGLFNTFGKIDGIDSDLLVTFNVTDTAGNLLQFNFNLNTVFKTEDAIERHWLLIDDAITIPDPSPQNTTGGGFEPRVDDWQEQYGEIVL